LGVKPSDLRNDPWCRKTRMMDVSDSERISMIRSAVLIQYTRVAGGRTDRRTELAWHICAIAYMLSRVKILAYFGAQTKKLLTLINVHPSGLFSGDYISALRGCCALKFLYALEINQGYLAHIPTGTWVPLKFNPEN